MQIAVIEGDDAAPEAMRPSVEILDRFRCPETIDVVLCGKDVKMHRKQPPLHDVRLQRLAQADGTVGLAHAEIKLIIAAGQLAKLL